MTEIVNVVSSNDGNSGNLCKPWPLSSRPYIPLTDGDRVKRGSRCLPRDSLGNSVPSESNLKIVDDSLGISRRSSNGSSPL